MGKSIYRRAGTVTSSFGTPGRINHDSTKFYESRLYEGLNKEKKVKNIENEISKENKDLMGDDITVIQQTTIQPLLKEMIEISCRVLIENLAIDMINITDTINKGSVVLN